LLNKNSKAQSNNQYLDSNTEGVTEHAY